MRRLLPLTFLLLFFLVACQKQGVFRPNTMSVTPTNPEILGEPILVTFSQLADNLERYQNVLIRVTGDFQPLAQPNCAPERGPRTRWSLISENKQMRVLGLEEVVIHLAWEGLNMTLDGVWRKYEGPLGCGKNAAAGTTWYLEIAQIVQPNPIPDFFLNGQPTPDPNATTTPPDGSPETPTIPDGTIPTPTSGSGSPGYPPPGETPTPTRTIATATPRPSPSSTPTIATITSPTTSATATTAQTGTATLPAGSSTATPTPSPTPGPGTPSVTPLPTSLPEPTTTGYPPPPY